MALILGSVFNDRKVTVREINFPYYILGFVFIGLLNTIRLIPLFLIDLMNWTSQLFIFMSVSSMATVVKIRDMTGDGLPVLVTGLIVFFCFKFYKHVAYQAFWYINSQYYCKC